MRLSKIFTSAITITEIQYVSLLPPEEVLKRLESNSEPENYLNPFRNSTSSKMFGGGTYGSKFTLMPQNFFIPSLTPTISGSVSCKVDNTIINVELICSTGAYSAFVLLLFLLASVNMVWNSMKSGFEALVLIIPAIIIFIFILNNLINYRITKQCCSDLAKIFEAEPQEI